MMATRCCSAHWRQPLRLVLSRSVVEMAYDEQLADRVRPLLKRRKGFDEKKMFGGVGFLLNGNMCVGVWKQFLIVRLGKEKHEQTMARPFTKEFDITGRVMKGWAMVEPIGLESDDELLEWVRQAARFADSLPAK
jgi:TfoX/Sxy family transcriptional regulator of competence genes